MTDFQVVLMAAGKGTRMRSKRIKVLHHIMGKPMLGHPIDAAFEAGATRVITVLGHDRQQVQAWMETHPHAERIEVAIQQEQLGTAHAVACASTHLAKNPDAITLILSGDVPNIQPETIRAFLADAQHHTLSVMTAKLDDPLRYGRIVRDEHDALAQIVEFADADEAQRQINEINTGIYAVKTTFLLDALETIMNAGANNAQAEYYLTDIAALAARDNQAHAWIIEDDAQTHGVNTRAQLAQAIEVARNRINAHWMAQGVTMLDPSRTYIDAQATLSADVLLYPDVHIEGASHIDEDVEIQSGCMIKDSTVGARTLIKSNCYIDSSSVGQDTNVGPFAHLRPGTQVGNDCKVGNFVEIKKSVLGDGAKASHLTYLGDATVGEKANIGAGTITCNYDGKNKSQTIIEAGAFIGSNSALVAPVTIGEGAYVGAGSTITNDVPSEALGVARSRQRNIDRWKQRKKS